MILLFYWLLYSVIAFNLKLIALLLFGLIHGKLMRLILKLPLKNASLHTYSSVQLLLWYMYLLYVTFESHSMIVLYYIGTGRRLSEEGVCIIIVLVLFVYMCPVCKEAIRNCQFCCLPMYFLTKYSIICKITMLCFLILVLLPCRHMH